MRIRAAHVFMLAVFVGLGIALARPSVAQPRDTAERAEQREDLAKRLIDGTDPNDSNDVMKRVVSLMDESHERLWSDFDVGAETQRVQAQILSDMDEAVERALTQSSNGSEYVVDGDERRMPKPKPQQPRDKGNDAGPQSAEGSGGGARSEQTDRSRSGPFEETRRGWGHLPPRDREEIVQGLREQVLEEFRPLIEEYYRSLAEPQPESQEP